MKRDLATAKGRRAQARRDGLTVWWRTFKSLFTPHPQTRYVFKEPETGWEAFISGKPGQAERNLRIATEAYWRLGGIQPPAISGPCCTLRHNECKQESCECSCHET